MSQRRFRLRDEGRMDDAVVRHAARIDRDGIRRDLYARERPRFPQHGLNRIYHVSD